MRAAAYHRFVPASLCIRGPADPSTSSSGSVCASTAKKKSGPRPAQAVPCCRSLASKVEVIASRSLGLAAFASSTSCEALDFSAAEVLKASPSKAAIAASRFKRSATEIMEPPRSAAWGFILWGAEKRVKRDARRRQPPPQRLRLHKYAIYGII